MEIELICEYCGKKFKRNKSEYNRSQRLGRRNYCSLSCVGKDNFNNIPIEKRYRPKNPNAGKKLDVYSPFRNYLKNIRNKKRGKKEVLIGLDDLKKQWEKQNGICPYSNWQLINYENTAKKLELVPNRASVDRIDSLKGYLPDNIQFVSYMANVAKNCFPEEELIKFCQAVTNHQMGIKTKNNFQDNFQKDEYSTFKYHLCNIRSHVKINGRFLSITLDDLKEQWEKQNGICFFTGWKMLKPTKKDYFPNNPEKASVDRIDSSKGYIPNNIQFVCCMANLAKNIFSSQELIEFCNAVSKNLTKE